MTNEWLKHLARLYLPLYQHESDGMKVGYAGYSSIKKNYFVRLLFNKNHQHTFRGRRLYWQIPYLIDYHNFDVVVSEISPFVMHHFHKYNGYIVPEWARMKILIDRPISEICRKSVSDFSDIMRRIRKYNMTYDILKGEENFDYFQKNLYLPYITKRHGKEAWIEDLTTIWESSPPPMILAIKEGGVIVGASLIQISQDTLYLLRLGLLDGNEEYRRHGVIGALYYFSVLEGQKVGCKYLDVGGARPFLTDGLTKFKMGLTAQFVSNVSKNNSYLWLGFNKDSVVATEFIKRNPLMHINKDYSLVRSGV